MNQRLFCLLLSLFASTSIGFAESSWRDEELSVRLQVGYAVRTMDLSGDGRLDIAIVDSKRFIWLESPTWKLHVMHQEDDAANDNVCFAPQDVDNDGDIDFAVGRDWQPNNTDSGGSIGWLRSPADPRDRWDYFEITNEPTTHRMNWADVNGDGRSELLVLPLKGRGSRDPGFDNTTLRILSLAPPQTASSATDASAWTIQSLDESLRVSHNLEISDLDQDGRDDWLTASFEGVTWFQPTSSGLLQSHLGEGNQGVAPAKGSSEVRLGHLTGDNPFIATIEPWHGNQVVVYLPPDQKRLQTLWTRHVLDEQLQWGHAVACANLDDDADEEIVIGVRDDASTAHRAGVRIYDSIAPSQGQWSRSLLQPGQVAVEDLVTADLDDDGDQDIVAVGRATHNVVIYWNE